MAASLLIKGYLNRITSHTREGKTSYFARIAYSTGRKDPEGKYSRQYIDAVLSNDLQGTGELLLGTAQVIDGRQEHVLSGQLLNLTVSNPFFSVYDGWKEGKGTFLNSEGILLAISPVDEPQ